MEKAQFNQTEDRELIRKFMAGEDYCFEVLLNRYKSKVFTTIYLIVKDDKIINFKYQCESCIYCQASVSLLSRTAKNKSIEKVKNFAKQAENCFEKDAKFFDKEWKEFDKIMKKNNISRKECLLLPVNTTLDALNKKSL